MTTSRTGQRTSNRCQRGFTLIELIVVVVILGVVLGMVAPRFATSIRSARVEKAGDVLLAGLTTWKERAEALRAPIEVTWSASHQALIATRATAGARSTADTLRLVGIVDLDVFPEPLILTPTGRMTATTLWLEHESGATFETTIDEHGNIRKP